MITKTNFNILNCKLISPKKLIPFESLIIDKTDLSKKLNDIYNCGEDENRDLLATLKEEFLNDLKIDLSTKLKDIDTKYILDSENEYKTSILLNLFLYGDNDENLLPKKLSDPIDPHFEYQFVNKVGTIKKRKTIIFNGYNYFSSNNNTNQRLSNHHTNSYTEYLLDYTEDEILNKLNCLEKIFKERKEFIKYLDGIYGNQQVFSQSKISNTYSYQMKWFIQSFFKVKSNSVTYNIRIEDINCGKVFAGAFKDTNGKIKLKNCVCDSITITSGSCKNIVIELNRYADAISIVTPVLDYDLILEAIEEMNKDVDNINEPFIYTNIKI